jgi:tetratricopeptide (TPR) repeat protein
MRSRGLGSRFYLTREPVILTGLSALVVALFLAVTGVSHAYHAQQDSLGKRWYDRGSKDLKDGRYEPAAAGFRTALLYSRDDYEYQLKLAQALIGEGRSAEASAYLANLWEREPENGVVNLELARIAAQKGDREQALRYYHNAIYATWNDTQNDSQNGNAAGKRQEARLELVNYLLGMDDRMQAQSELIALAANLGDDPAQHMRAGELFFQAHDYGHAMEEYRLSLKAEPRNAAALAGAGRAAFELGNYGQAVRYLQAALTENPSDAKLAEELKEAALAVQRIAKSHQEK